MPVFVHECVSLVDSVSLCAVDCTCENVASLMWSLYNKLLRWGMCKAVTGLGWSTRSQTFLLNFDCCVWPLVVLKPGCHGGRPTVSTCTCKLLYRCLGSEWRVHIDRWQWQWIALLLSDTKILHDKHFVQYCHTSILTCNCDLIVIVHCVSLCLKNVPTLSCYNFLTYMNWFWQFLEEMLLRK